MMSHSTKIKAQTNLPSIHITHCLVFEFVMNTRSGLQIIHDLDEILCYGDCRKAFIWHSPRKSRLILGSINFKKVCLNYMIRINTAIILSFRRDKKSGVGFWLVGFQNKRGWKSSLWLPHGTLFLDMFFALPQKSKVALQQNTRVFTPIYKKAFVFFKAWQLMRCYAVV